MTQLKTIKSWSPDDRPREKMMTKGPSAMSDAELLAILIGTGTRAMSALELAKQLLARVDNNLATLGTLDLHAFKQVNGIGPAKAVTIMSAIELGRRRRVAKAKVGDNVTSSQTMYEILLPKFENRDHEVFVAVFLNARNNIIDIVQLGEGSAVATVVDVRRLMRLTVDLKAVNVIVAHNHPSGSLQPSEQDHQLTRKIRDGLELFGCKLLDHLIVTDSDYFSYANSHTLVDL
jgi:DNA repair protein RadC